jgi:membrane fusion protein
LNAPLFRPEVINNQGEKLAGDVILSQPVSYYLISLFLAIATLSGLAFLLANDYSRKQTVAGFLVPDNGLIDIYPAQSGILYELKVNEGDLVNIDSELFKLNIEQGSTESFYVSEQLLHELNNQEALLKQSITSEEEFLEGYLTQHGESMLNLKNEIRQLEELREIHATLNSLESQAFQRAQRLFDRGIVAQSSLEEAQQKNLRSQLELQNLNLSLTQKQAEFNQAQLDRETFVINSQRKITDLGNSLFELNKQKANTHASRVNVMHSPVSGHITSLVSEAGQFVNPNTAVLSIIPAESILEAQLYIPTRAVGFLELGQTVNIKYDAFPHERFGIYTGIVSNISNSVLSANELKVDLQINQPVYKVTVTLDQQAVTAYGENYLLKPGMLLTADVILDKRSLFEWLLEPLYSLRGVI